MGTGFGSDPWGSGPFGTADWAHSIVWNRVPTKFRDLDVDAGGYLETFLEAFEQQLTIMQQQIYELPLQRDPLYVRANEVTETVRIASVTNEVDANLGTVTTLTLEAGETFSQIGPGWIGTFDDVSFGVVLIRTREVIDAPIIMLKGTVPITIDPVTVVAGEDSGFDGDTSETEFSFGTANRFVVESSVTVSASGVADMTDDGAGVLSGADGTGTIDYATGEISLSYTTAPGVGDITVDYTYGGYALVTMQARNLMNHLARDFGQENDTNEPELAQRSAIKDIVQWLELKATERSYQIRSEMSGFSAEVSGLYKIQSSLLNLLPSDRTWELPIGSGEYFTDIPPKILAFDDFRADVVPTDRYCYEDDSPDGLSEGAAFASNLGTFTVATVTGSAGNWTVNGTILAAEHDLSDNYDGGRFYIDDGSGTKIFIEEELSWSDPNWSVRVATASAPATGAYTLKYNCAFFDSCAWAKTSRVVIKLTALPEILQPGYDKQAAAIRLIAKLERLLPVHVSVVSFVLNFEATLQVQMASTISGVLVFV